VTHLFYQLFAIAMCNATIMMLIALFCRAPGRSLREFFEVSTLATILHAERFFTVKVAKLYSARGWIQLALSLSLVLWFFFLIIYRIS
jgi:hypothetical protein